MLRDYRVNGRQSLEVTEQRWKKHLLPFFGNLRAVDVATDLVNRYIEQRKQGGAENGTINRDMAALKQAFYLGYRSSPRKVYHVPVFPRLKENAPRKGVVQNREYLGYHELPYPRKSARPTWSASLPFPTMAFFVTWNSASNDRGVGEISPLHS